MTWILRLLVRGWRGWARSTHHLPPLGVVDGDRVVIARIGGLAHPAQARPTLSCMRHRNRREYIGKSQST
jgi:hypothetical protein